MKDISRIAADKAGFSDEELCRLLDEAIGPFIGRLRKVLLLPPDYTRYHSGAGKITAHLYNRLKPGCTVHIMPALGSHAPVTEAECRDMYLGQVPYEALIRHNWRTDVATIGKVPGSFVSEVSEGLVDEPIPVQLNRRLLDPSYDLILSIGQVVPHEVVGMANGNKNLLVGCGGADMISKTHMLGAYYGMERLLGKDHSPVRKVFDYAERNYLERLPLKYILTVTTQHEGRIRMHGLFIGRERGYYEQAVALSQRTNLTLLDAPIQKCVVYLDEREFKATWVGNKAVYRTRMAIEDGGELIVLAPGVSMYCEDADNDALIGEYGYCGRDKVLQLVKTQTDLARNLSAAAHLIHGSSEGRFRITYATRQMSEADVRRVHYDYMPYDEAVGRYNPAKLADGYNTLPDGEQIYYIGNPAVGLWMDKAKL